MSRPDSVDAERAHRLMMAALDGEISPEERRELDEILEQQTSHSDLGAYLRHHLLGDL